ncbi:MAG: hypothetical protein SOT19_02625 [Muribaculaceae bacterium]|nr:hypothetical protein [Muribaculaceae bacterium]
MNKRIIWAIAALLALAGIAVSVKIYMNEKKADAEARMHSKIEYDEWFDDHSCQGIDYRDYSDFGDYVQAVFDKKRVTTYVGSEKGKEISVTFFGNSNKVRIVEDGHAIEQNYRPVKYGIFISGEERKSQNSLDPYEIRFPYDNNSNVTDPDNENASLRTVYFINRTGGDPVITELQMSDN